MTYSYGGLVMGFANVSCSADLIIDDPKDMEFAIDVLSKQFPDAWLNSDGEMLFLTIEESVRYTYEPEVRQGGGGTPEYLGFEEFPTFESEDEFRDFLDDVLKPITFEIDKISYDVDYN